METLSQAVSPVQGDNPFDPLAKLTNQAYMSAILMSQTGRLLQHPRCNIDF